MPKNTTNKLFVPTYADALHDTLQTWSTLAACDSAIVVARSVLKEHVDRRVKLHYNHARAMTELLAHPDTQPIGKISKVHPPVDDPQADQAPPPVVP